MNKIDILYKNYIPINTIFKNIERIIYVSHYTEINSLYININTLCDIFPPERWKRQYTIIPKISVESYVSSNKGTWISTFLFEDFGDWLSKKNNDNTLIGFGQYIKNNIKNLFDNYTINSDPYFTLINNHHVRANENGFICITDIIDIHNRDIRSWKKNDIFKQYILKNPTHCLSDNSSIDAFGFKVSFTHPSLALINLDWLYKSCKDKNDEYRAIKIFIEQHLSNEEKQLLTTDIIQIFKNLSSKEMKEECKRIGMNNYYKLTKDGLVDKYTKYHNSLSLEPLVEEKPLELYKNPIYSKLITSDDFKDCRITPDNNFSIYDCIATFKGCSSPNACDIYNRLKIGFDGIFMYQFIKKRWYIRT